MSDQSATIGHKKVSLLITNEEATPLTVCLEPWGDEHKVPPNKAVTVDLTAESLQPISISHKRGRVTILGWEGSVAEVWYDGQLLS